MNADQNELEALATAWLMGQATPEQASRLGALVEAEPAARDRLLVLADLHACLMTDERLWAERFETARLEPARPVTVRRRIPAALAFVAGLLFGFVPLVFGYTRSEPKNSVAGPVPVVDGDFESDVAPGMTGLADRSGVWSGDIAALVTGPQQAVKPFSGQRMFQFLRSDYEGERFTRSATGEVLQVIDLRGWSRPAGPVAVEVSGRVNAVRPSAGEEYRWVAHAFALDIDPTTRRGEPDYSWLYRECLAAAHQPGVLDDDDATRWQRVALEAFVPESASFLVVSFGVQRTQPAPTAEPTNFSGHYLDAVEVTPTTRSRR
ncbi:MAG: hypothetical protein JNM18_23670 [Planctomycetaceae bacterium]|nr:hypothetical protein [Planctomycetaceae bacterium]